MLLVHENMMHLLDFLPPGVADQNQMQYHDSVCFAMRSKALASRNTRRSVQAVLTTQWASGVSIPTQTVLVGLGKRSNSLFIIQ